MAFIQIIQYHTSKIDEMRAIGHEWEAKASGDRKATRILVCADRDNPGRYMSIVFFDSYEEAMENSNLPATHEFSSRMMELGDGPPAFFNLDVLEER